MILFTQFQKNEKPQTQLNHSKYFLEILPITISVS